MKDKIVLFIQGAKLIVGGALLLGIGLVGMAVRRRV